MRRARGLLVVLVALFAVAISLIGLAVGVAAGFFYAGAQGGFRMSRDFLDEQLDRADAWAQKYDD